MPCSYPGSRSLGGTASPRVWLKTISGILWDRIGHTFCSLCSLIPMLSVTLCLVLSFWVPKATYQPFAEGERDGRRLQLI